MNKRGKKKLAKKHQYQGVIQATGNNGGDILEIRDNMDGTVHLKVGHCCVIVIDQIVPVEFLTAIMEDVVLANNRDVGAIIDGFMWSQEFKDKLKAKCSH